MMTNLGPPGCSPSGGRGFLKNKNKGRRGDWLSGSPKEEERNFFRGVRGALKKKWWTSWGWNKGYEFVPGENLVRGCERAFQARARTYKNKLKCWISILGVSSHNSGPIYYVSPFSHSLFQSCHFLPFPVPDFLPEPFGSSTLLSVWKHKAPVLTKNNPLLCCLLCCLSHLGQGRFLVWIFFLSFFFS